MMKIQFKGIPGIIAMVVIAAGYVGYRGYLQRDLVVDARVEQQLKGYLASEVSGDITADARAISEAIARGDNATAEQLANGVVTRKVELQQLSMRGRGDNIVVKCTYAVQGPEGPEQKTGYFKFAHSAISGWRCLGHTTAITWHLTWM
jgi:hypothetical protein